MSTEITKSFDIKNGPNRDALIDAFKYAYDEGSHIALDFGIALIYLTDSKSGLAWAPMKIKNIRLSSIEHDCCLGHSFNLEGTCEADLCIRRYDEEVLYKVYRFKAFYDTKSRIGFIEFVMQP